MKIKAEIYEIKTKNNEKISGTELLVKDEQNR